MKGFSMILQSNPSFFRFLSSAIGTVSTGCGESLLEADAGCISAEAVQYVFIDR
jgi:hypothetical protein